MSETEARHAADATPVEPEPQSAAGSVAEPVAGPGDGSVETDLEPGVTDARGKHALTDPDADLDADPDAEPETETEPSWWHRSHPTFAGLVGFYAGVAYVIIVPGVYAALLSWLAPEKTAEKLFPLVLIALIVPIGMLVARKTRRFAQFMFLGILSTALVVAATAGLVLWILVKRDG